MLPTEAQQYGAWIRAPPFVQVKGNLVSILGFYRKKKKKKKPINQKTTSTTTPPKKPPVVI